MGLTDNVKSIEDLELSGRRVFMRDKIHFTPAGHAMMAKILADALSDLQLLEYERK